MSGGGNYKAKVISLLLHKPVQVYFGGATFLYSVRWYQTQSTFNYWFGKQEFQRRVERHAI
jgi:hypothetical protein